MAALAAVELAPAATAEWAAAARHTRLPLAHHLADWIALGSEGGSVDTARDIIQLLPDVEYEACLYSDRLGVPCAHARLEGWAGAASGYGRTRPPFRPEYPTGK
jgi:hypothetical protein